MLFKCKSLSSSSSFVAFENLEGRALLSSDLPYGQIVGGNIGSAGQVDQYTFDAPAGAKVELTMTSAPQAGFKAKAELFTPSGRRMAYFWAGGQARYTLPDESGTYMVQISDANVSSTGGYSLGWEGVGPISPGPVAIQAGGIKAGRISKPLQVDQYTFAADAGDRIELALTSEPRPGFKPRAELFTPSGRRFAYFWAGGQARYTLPQETGTYMVQVMDVNAQATGGYTIGLESVAPASADAQWLGPARKGVIGSAIDVDQYRFTARAGEKIRLTLATRATDVGFSPMAELFDPAGNKVGYWRGGSADSWTSYNGDYLVQIEDANYQKRGTYTLSAQWLSPARGAIAGSVFNDVDGDGKRDAGETAMGGWRVFIDGNGNGRWDDGERSELTDVLGNWAFTSLGKGTYRIGIVAQDGWQLTSPPGVNARTRVIKLAKTVVMDGNVFSARRIG